MKQKKLITAYMRACFIALILPLIASCRLDGPDRDPITESELSDYARRSLISLVALPVETIEMALELDEYLSLDEEELMNSDFVRKYTCHISGDNLYILTHVSDKVDRTIRCQFTTGGKSIRVPGNEWIVDGVHIYGYSEEFNLYNYQFQLPEASKLSMNSDQDSTWTLIMNGGRSEMKLQSKADSLYTWTVNAEGTEITSSGIKASFGTGSGLKLRETVQETGDRINAYSGQFNVDIYRDGKLIDYCYMNFVEGRNTDYKTSRY